MSKPSGDSDLYGGLWLGIAEFTGLFLYKYIVYSQFDRPKGGLEI